MNIRTSARPRLAAAIAGFGSIALALGGLAVLASPSASAEPRTGGKNDCKSFGVPGSQLKIESPSGTVSKEGAKGFKVTVTVRTLTADDPSVDGDQTGNQVFDFTASRGVYAVVVKGGPKGELYDYRPEGKSEGTGLHAKVNPNNQKFYDLSHISFCYNPCPPSPTPTPTKPTIPTIPTISTKPPTSQPTQPSLPTQPTSQPTVPVPTETTPEPTPSDGGGPSGTPSTSETPDPAIPTEVDAGADGNETGVKLLGSDGDSGGNGALAGGLLGAGALLLCLATLVLVKRRRGQHSI